MEGLSETVQQYIEQIKEFLQGFIEFKIAQYHENPTQFALSVFNGLVPVLVPLYLVFIKGSPATPPRGTAPPPAPAAEKPGPEAVKSDITESIKMMSAPTADLPAPLNTPVTIAQLSQCNGVPEGSPIWLAIKGTVFDVTSKPEMYGPGKGYSVFAAKDASKGLGMSSLKPEDAIADYSSLGPKEMDVLNKWYEFFEKRYPIVGKVVA